MAQAVPHRRDVAVEHTWDTESVFPSNEAWQNEIEQVLAKLPELDRFHGRLGESATTLADYFQASEQILRSVNRIFLYARMLNSVDTTDQAATEKYDRAMGIYTRATSALAFAEPEILAIPHDTLRQWIAEEPRLTVYEHYFDQLQRRKTHIRSAEVEELLSRVMDPFMSATRVHGTLADADLQYQPARTSDGDTIDITQGTIGLLVTDPDREVRRSAWENYADAHLAMKNTFANCITAGVKQHVFLARARGYQSSLEAALTPNHIPTDIFYNLIETYRRHLPTWHRYWSLRRRALGYDALHAYDIKAPLTSGKPHIPFEQAVDWISEGMQPLGNEYIDTMRRGVLEQRWVDIYPNKGKRSGAFSSGVQGTHPFILMSYVDDIFSMSTLAHELGHSMHSYFSWQTQPLIYSRYTLFVAEVASNFNQALVRAHLLESHNDVDFQIAVIEEAMSNFHRYFFIMPTLARFELEIHERVERGEGLTADGLIALMTDLFKEGYGDEVAIDTDRIGITWAQFATHMYSNFYVYQYATGISAAHALADKVLQQGATAKEQYLSFLKAGNSMYPLDALKLAGVDMSSPEPVEHTFGVLAGMVDRLEELLAQRVENTGAIG
jgi:oligoendopeptidase F